MRLEVQGAPAHGATPWLGDNAVLKAIDVFRSIESLPFARHSSDLFDRPSINLGRILGGDALNKVPDTCVIDVDIRYLPDQDPDEILEQVSGLPDTEACSPPSGARRRWSSPTRPFVQGLCEAASPHHPERVMSVGRDGASDAVSFLRGRACRRSSSARSATATTAREEWVSISSLRSYRQALEGFVEDLPGDGRGMSPEREEGGTDQGDEQPRADETQEHELGDDFREDTGDEEADQDEVEEEDTDDDDLDDEDLEEDDYDQEDDEDLDEHEDELQQVVSAETQEWDGLEAAEAEGEAEKTVVASTGDRVKQAHSSITSGFEKVSHSAGPKITSGFKAVRIVNKGNLYLNIWILTIHHTTKCGS